MRGDAAHLARRVATRRRIAGTLRAEADRLDAEVAKLRRRAGRMDAQADELEGGPWCGGRSCYCGRCP